MRLTCTVFFVLGLALPAFAQNVATAPPQAQVTFYSHGVTVMGGLPGHEPGAFKGRIYDEDHQLAFIEPGHFVTFNLNPGLHILSATWWITKHAKGGSHVTINLVADQHYFIETSVLNSGFAFGNLNLVIKEVTCEGAQQDNVHNKPLEPTHLRPDGVPIAVLDKAFPQCP
jgi:hypothetical protein